MVRGLQFVFNMSEKGFSRLHVGRGFKPRAFTAIHNAYHPSPLLGLHHNNLKGIRRRRVDSADFRDIADPSQDVDGIGVPQVDDETVPTGQSHGSALRRRLQYRIRALTTD